MNTSELVQFLREHNRWRRGDDSLEMANPTVIKLSKKHNPNNSNYVDEVYSWGFRNPLNHTEIVIDGVKLELSIFSGKVHINSIQSIETNKGHGTKLMQRLTKLADNMNVELSLNPDIMGNSGIRNIKKLINWYEKFGFLGNLSGMNRKPMSI